MAAEDTDHTIGHGRKSEETRIIGLVVPDVTSPLFAEIARGAGDAAWERGCRTLLCETTGDQKREQTALELLETLHADGIVLCDPCLPDEYLLSLIERHPATAVLNRPLSDHVAVSIRIDHADGMRQAVNHLLSSGRRTIGFLSAPSLSFSSRERARWLERGLEAAGCAMQADLQVSCSSTWEGGYVAARDLLRLHSQVDALICHNDLVAVGALHACVGLRKHVPEDVAIVGCDDILLARVVTPALTTLHVPKYEIGTAAVRLLVERMEGCQQQDELVFTPRLVVRASAPSD